MLHDRIRRGAYLAGLGAAALTMTACNGAMAMGDGNGVPLAELDRTGPAPTELVLAGPDAVTVMEGPAFDIAVAGDPRAVEALRFSLDDGTLEIGRDRESGHTIGRAEVRVTTPSLSANVLAGSGSIEAPLLAGDVETTIAGSGSVRIGEIAADEFDLTIAGSGTFEGGGTAERLELTIAGSGSGRMADLRAGRAEVSIVGSGNAVFASDGKVDASVMGSGGVVVTGNADCTVSKMGSGNVTCRASAAN